MKQTTACAGPTVGARKPKRARSWSCHVQRKGHHQSEGGSAGSKHPHSALICRPPDGCAGALAQETGEAGDVRPAATVLLCPFILSQVVQHNYTDTAQKRTVAGPQIIYL
jgi:hypothetical protein